MKAVVIDIKMPKRCATCPIRNGCGSAEYAKVDENGIETSLEKRPKQCPLKQVEISDDSESDSMLDEIREILDYLNTATGSSYRATTKKNKVLIRARLREGFTVDDFKTVIDKKVKAWGKDPKMQGFLRPMTLFGTKFESYLNEKCTSRLGENSFQRLQRMAREGAFDD